VDLSFTAEQEGFRREAREWLRVNVPVAPLPSMDTAEGFERHRAWERTLHEAGWAVVSWPKEYGGRGATLQEWLIFEEEYWAAGGPGRVGQNGLFLLGPTLMDHGTDEQKARFLPPMASGEEVWCQGWSEPNAGSDLASLRSKARRDDEHWILSGQKTWCSRGAFAEWMFGLFRSDPGSERHRGLSFILVPLDAPGVTVRPIAQLDGETGFAEVFLDDVRVPVEQNTVGAEGDGWKIAMSTAGFERGLLLRSPGRFMATAARLLELYGRVGAETPPELRDRVVRSWMDVEAYRLATDWTVSRLLDGGTIGAEASLNKIFWSEMDLALHETALELLGPSGELADEGLWMDGYLFSLAGPIYAGTNEIQRNVIAERILGLPKG
jgi:alkylation response protein AidB-like acyl-CoA dehydrogenase